jgi:hypothetical protein
MMSHSVLERIEELERRVKALELQVLPIGGESTFGRAEDGAYLVNGAPAYTVNGVPYVYCLTCGCHQPLGHRCARIQDVLK